MSFNKKAIFYSSHDRSLFFLRLDEYYRRVSGPAMLMLSLDHEMSVTDTKGREHDAVSFLVPAGSPVTIKAKKARVLICFLEPTGTDVKSLLPFTKHRIVFDDKNWLASTVKHENLLIQQAKALWQEVPDAAVAMKQFEGWIKTFHESNYLEHHEVDKRVVKAINIIRDQCNENVPVKEIAKEVALSEPRLTQLFRITTGTSIRRFRLWERVFYAARCLQAGMNLTDAAIAAGFSDYCQCFRVYRELGGCHPQKTKSSTQVKVAPDIAKLQFQ